MVDSVHVDLVNMGLTVGEGRGRNNRGVLGCCCLGCLRLRWCPTAPHCFIEEPNVRRNALHEAGSERAAWCVGVVKDERLGGGAFRDARLVELLWKIGTIGGKPRMYGVAVCHGGDPQMATTLVRLPLIAMFLGW